MQCRICTVGNHHKYLCKWKAKKFVTDAPVDLLHLIHLSRNSTRGLPKPRVFRGRCDGLHRRGRLEGNRESDRKNALAAAEVEHVNEGREGGRKVVKEDSRKQSAGKKL